MRSLALVCAALILASCGRSNNLDSDSPLSGQLPPLSTLHGNGLARSVSATEFELIGSVPGVTSPSGVDTAGGVLALDPPTDGMAWAVYALQGFPTDGSVVPVSVTIDRDMPCWIAFADFGRNVWELVPCDSNATYTPLSSSLLSADGTFYVAVIGFPGTGNPGGDCTVSSLSVQVSADVELPAPLLKVISATGDLAAGVPSYFNAEGSLAGADATIQSLTYNWNDGSPTDETLDPLSEVNHIWTAPGTQTVTLTLLNDSGVSVSRNYQLSLVQPCRELLLVYNSDLPQSVDLAAYYASSHSGRLIDPAYILGLPLGSNANADFDRPTYNSLIRDPIKTHLDASGYKDSIKYILLVKGVPHRISDTGDSAAAVDSELCTLYSDLGPINGGYPYDEWLINDPHGLDMGAHGFYLKGNTNFKANTFKVSHDPTWQQPNSGDETQYTLNYLVGRLSAYTYEEARLLVDRSINADKTGEGWTIFDSTPELVNGTPMHNLDTMVDPVFPYIVEMNSGYDLLLNAGFNVFADDSPDDIFNTYPSLPAGAGSAVLAYCSWGTHAFLDSDYILNDLQFTYLPGACFMSYESYNAWNFDGDNLSNRAGQGQICDFVRMGGSCAIGNAWEPYNLGIGDERWVFSRYIISGDRWIEAAYKGLRLLSWMEVVVGDPLCTVK